MARFFRFRVISLFALTTLVCIALAWFMRPKQVVAEATLVVRSQPDRLLPAADSPFFKRTPEEVAQFRVTTLLLARGDRTIQATLLDPTLAKCALLREVDDPVGWLQSKLEVEFVGESDVMAIRIRGPEAWAADLKIIVDAVADAFEDTVVAKRRLERTRRLDDLRSYFARLNEEIPEKLEELYSITQEIPPEKRDMHPEIVVRHAEVQALLKKQAELAEQLEQFEIEHYGCPRITLNHSAVIRQD